MDVGKRLIELEDFPHESVKGLVGFISGTIQQENQDAKIKIFDHVLVCEPWYTEFLESVKSQWRERVRDGIQVVGDTKQILDEPKLVQQILLLSATQGAPPASAHAFWQSVATAVHETGNLEIARLKADARSDFCSLWQEKVTQRIQLYREALETIGDAKLKQQLQGPAVSYVIKEIIPDTLAQAEVLKLVRGNDELQQAVEKLKKKLSRFTESSSSQESPLRSLGAIIEQSVLKKLDLDWLAAEPLSEGKTSLINSIVRSMQKDSDGPRLFLSLMTVLFSQYKRGVIYATGRFAPRLLKLLKDDISVEQYSRLEELKDLVKSGQVTGADFAEMRELAKFNEHDL